MARDREAATVDIVLPNVDCASIAVASAARRQPLHLRRREGHRRLRAQANIPAYIVPTPGRPRPDEPVPTSTTSAPLTTNSMPGGDFSLARTATTLPIANAGRPKPSAPENPRRSACLGSVRLSTSTEREFFGHALVVYPSLYQLYTIQPDGERRMASVHELRPKTPDSEKITVNLGFIDLGRVDLMVRDGFYANRADFIRTAVRNQLERQDDAVRQSVARRQLKLGLSHYTRQDLEAARDAGTPLLIQVLGLASIAGDVTPELARAAIASVQVLGAFHVSPAVKAALADRTT